MRRRLRRVLRAQWDGIWCGRDALHPALVRGARDDARRAIEWVMQERRQVLNVRRKLRSVQRTLDADRMGQHHHRLARPVELCPMRKRHLARPLVWTLQADNRLRNLLAQRLMQHVVAAASHCAAWSAARFVEMPHSLLFRAICTCRVQCRDRLAESQ